MSEALFTEDEITYAKCRDCSVELTIYNRGFCFPFQCEDCENKYFDNMEQELIECN